MASWPRNCWTIWRCRMSHSWKECVFSFINLYDYHNNNNKICLSMLFSPQFHIHRSLHSRRQMSKKHFHPLGTHYNAIVDDWNWMVADRSASDFVHPTPSECHPPPSDTTLWLAHLLLCVSPLTVKCANRLQMFNKKKNQILTGTNIPNRFTNLHIPEAHFTIASTGNKFSICKNV